MNKGSKHFNFLIMETNIKIFTNPDFGQIRTITMPDGQVGFVGKDVAKVLGYTNPTKACRVHIEEDDKGMYKMDTPSGTQQTLIINESGLYALILASKLPKAREFKHSTEPIQMWVERGIFDTHVTIINTNHGQRESITTKVTGKGQKYFINLFIHNNI